MVIIDDMNNPIIPISRLTEQREEFAQHYAIHRKPSAAYRFAFDTSNWKAQSVAVEAQKLLNDPNVALRIWELQQLMTRDHVMSVNERLNILATIARCSLRPQRLSTGEVVLTGDVKAAVAAISEYNKMTGDHAAKKVDVGLFDPKELPPMSDLFDVESET